MRHVLAIALAGCAAAPPDELGQLRTRFPLHADEHAVASAADAHCTDVTTHHYAGAQAAPYRTQMQVDCMGYVFAGAPRKLELLINEGALGFYWLLLTDAELPATRAALIQRFGEPTCGNDLYAIFEAQGVALRNEPAEILVALPTELDAITGGCD